MHEISTVLCSIYIYLIRYLYLVLLYQYNIRMQNIAGLRSVDIFSDQREMLRQLDQKPGWKLKKLALRSAVAETRFTTEERTQTSSCHNTVQ